MQTMPLAHNLPQQFRPSHHNPQRIAGAISVARKRGWITLDDVMEIASGSPVDLEEAIDAARNAGIEVVDADDAEDDPWADVGALADGGADTFGAPQRNAPDVTDDLMAGGPASLYLREISRTPLLTADEEVMLAKQLEAGKAAHERLDGGVDDRAERERLEADLATGEAARIRLIESNLRLVVSVARKYIGRGLSFLDLVQEGNIGLQRGVDKYDWRRGFRFSTYAYWWIRQAVSRAVAEQSRTIRLPVHVVEQLSKLYNAARDLEHQLGRRPTPEEIGERMGISAARVEEAFRAARVPISLEKTIGDENDSTLADLVADEAGIAPAEAAEELVFAQAVERSLSERLTPREAEVLRLRYGLIDHRERTLAEVGQELGISRERARQLEATAMQKLRRDVPFRRAFQEHVN